MEEYIIDEDRKNLIVQLKKELDDKRYKNWTKAGAYYHSKNKLKDLSVSTPVKLQNLDVSLGWAKTVVDTHNDRLNLVGFTYPDGQETISDILKTNNLESVSGLAHKDALIYGISYVVVGAGDPADGEPPVVISVESPLNMYGEFNHRKNELDNALKIHFNDEDKMEWGILYEKGRTTTFEVRGDIWYVVEEDVHNNVVPVFRIVNRESVEDYSGRSEITPPIRNAIDTGMRILVAAEVSREFYTMPRKTIIGADDSAFAGLSAIDIYANLINIVPATRELDSSGESVKSSLPVIHQDQISDPGVYTEMLRLQAAIVSSASKVPLGNFGFYTEQPASADAIRSSDSPLVKAAETKQNMFGISWSKVMAYATFIATGERVKSVITPIWRSAEIPTRAADADALTKLIAAGVIPATSEVALSKASLTEAEKEIIRRERLVEKRGAAVQAIADIRAARSTVEQNPVVANALAQE